MKGFTQQKVKKSKKLRLYQSEAIPEKMPGFVGKETTRCQCCGRWTFEVNLNHPEVLEQRRQKKRVTDLLKSLGFVDAMYFDNMTLEEFNYLVSLYPRIMQGESN
jgi:hypothetical protein